MAEQLNYAEIQSTFGSKAGPCAIAFIPALTSKNS